MRSMFVALAFACVTSVASVAGGCYSPNLERCTVTCQGNETCPDNLTCQGDGFCHATDDTTACGGGGGGGGGGGDSGTQMAALAITVVGDGNGNVTSGTPVLDCGTDDNACTAQVPVGTRVTLDAEADSDSIFFGWSANCSGDPCVIEIDDNTTVTAEFDLAVTVTIEFAGNGDGTITSSPLGLTPSPCDDATVTTCTGTFASGKSLVLTATPDNDGSTFGGWEPGTPCDGQGTTCTFVPTADTTTGAEFD